MSTHSLQTQTRKKQMERVYIVNTMQSGEPEQPQGRWSGRLAGTCAEKLLGEDMKPDFSPPHSGGTLTRSKSLHGFLDSV